MSSQISVKNMLAELLAISHPLAPFDMPLLDAHGATLADNIYLDDQVVLRKGVRIRSPQIGLAASLGLPRLPTQPHPRVVVISAGDDLMEPGQEIAEAQEFEINSWMLATAAKEAGAVAYRVHTVPENPAQLRAVIEDQMVRADLIVISGESHDGSFELIRSVLDEIGDVDTATPNLQGSSVHCYGIIGEDGIPVVVLPGNPMCAFISFEIFIRPMIRTMLGVRNVFRASVKAEIAADVESPIGEASLIRATLFYSEAGELGVRALSFQDDLVSLSEASAFITVSADSPGYLKGEIAEIIVMDRTV
jgi:molybdopterin molybdotransferase